MEKAVLNADIGEVLSFSQSVWSALMKSPGPRAFRPVVMAAVTVIIASFFAAIIIATRQVVGVSNPDDVILLLVVGLRWIRIGEIVDVAASELIDGRVK